MIADVFLDTTARFVNSAVNFITYYTGTSCHRLIAGEH